jgi:hypothetical protein
MKIVGVLALLIWPSVSESEVSAVANSSNLKSSQSNNLDIRSDIADTEVATVWEENGSNDNFETRSAGSLCVSF